MDRKSAHNGGFTLVEMMIVIGVIVTLMGLVVVVGPLVFEMVKETQTENNLNLLAQALANYKDVFLPEDTTYEDNVADNAHLIEKLEELGIEEKILKDGWGNIIFYDNLKDNNGEPAINRSLPDNPIAEEFPSHELSDEDKEKLRWDFVIWSRGPDIEDISDNLSKRGLKK